MIVSNRPVTVATLTVAGLLAGLLAGCQDSKRDAAAQRQPPPTQQVGPQVQACSGALGSFNRFVDVGSGSDSPETFARVKEAVLQRCIEDKWSERALACMRGAATSHDTFGCWNEELTKEQREAATQALGQLQR
ncbi:MAG: hypothetical protein M3680_24645 [Myxococcota bacterium]|nr:hypothetical protein [Myxococcota bacterium]